MICRIFAISAILVTACQSTSVERTVVMNPGIETGADDGDKITLTTKSPKRKTPLLEDEVVIAECWAQLSELEQLLEDEPTRASEISAGVGAIAEPRFFGP